jgi:RNA polymerase sigma factor (sigma-70 family)
VALAHLSLELANAARREVAHHAATAIERLLTVLQQPVHHKRGFPALLGSHAGVGGGNGSHVFLFPVFRPDVRALALPQGGWGPSTQRRMARSGIRLPDVFFVVTSLVGERHSPLPRLRCHSLRNPVYRSAFVPLHAEFPKALLQRQRGMSEEELIGEIRKGGRAMHLALRVLYDTTGPHMVRFFVYQGVPADEAQDILQETLVKVVRKVDTYQGEGTARAWIWQIARNCLVDHQRAAGRVAEHVVAVNDEQWDVLVETTPGPADCAVGETADECVSLGLDDFAGRMPERALVLTLQMDGMSITEIAERIGRTTRATTVYLSECRKKVEPFIAHCVELLPS